MAERDLNHKEGNATLGLPKSLLGKTVLTDPHATPGKTIKTVKKTERGWNKGK